MIKIERSLPKIQEHDFNDLEYLISLEDNALSKLNQYILTSTKAHLYDILYYYIKYSDF